MSEETLFNEGGVVVTTARLESGGMMHPIRGIGSVKVERDFTAAIAFFVLIGVLGLFGAMWAGGRYGPNVGLAAFVVYVLAAVGALVFVRGYRLVVASAGGDKTALIHRDREFVERVLAAVREAIARQA